MKCSLPAIVLLFSAPVFSQSTFVNFGAPMYTPTSRPSCTYRSSFTWQATYPWTYYCPGFITVAGGTVQGTGTGQCDTFSNYCKVNDQYNDPGQIAPYFWPGQSYTSSTYPPYFSMWVNINSAQALDSNGNCQSQNQTQGTSVTQTDNANCGGGGDCPSGCTDPCSGDCLNSCDEDSGCDSSPIVLDTRDNGFHLTSVAEGVRFRTLPGGRFYQMSWTDPYFGNGWLALDRNGNGTIDDFSELFGNLTPQPPSTQPNGFLALSVFDDPSNGGNGNGVIDPGDSIYSRLRVWVDANQNGFSEPTELHTLQELGIFKIGLAYTETPFVDQYGNRFRFRGSVWDDEGLQREACYDVFVKIQTKSQ